MIPPNGPGSALAATPFRELGIGDLSQVNWEIERSDDRGASFRLAHNGVDPPQDLQLRI